MPKVCYSEEEMYDDIYYGRLTRNAYMYDEPCEDPDVSPAKQIMGGIRVQIDMDLSTDEFYNATVPIGYSGYILRDAIQLE